MPLPNLIHDFELFLKGPVALFRWKNTRGWPVDMATPNVQEIFGYSAEDFTSGAVSYAELIHPEDLDRVGNEVQRFQESGRGYLTHKPYRVRRRDGGWIWLLDCTIAEIDSQGQTQTFVGYVLDITERVQSQEALQSNLDRLKLLSKMISEANRAETLDEVYQCAVSGVLSLLNAQRTAILVFGEDQRPHFVAWEGLSKDYRTQVDGHSPWNPFEISAQPIYIPEVSASDLEPELRQTILDEGIGALGFFPLAGPDRLLGKFMVYYDQPHVLSSEDLHFAQILAEELAAIIQRMVALETARNVQKDLKTKNEYLTRTLQELQDTQETMVRRERLAAIGQLVTGVAHDFNNLLSGILGYSELILASPTLEEENQRDLLKVVKASKRGAALVKQLLDYSRKTTPKTQVLDLGPFLKYHMEFLRPLLPESLLVRVHLPLRNTTPISVSADPNQLQQLLTNLVLNAKDAMPLGGDLELSLERVQEEGNRLCATCTESIRGDYAKIRVRDSGRGIPLENLDRIFEPFMTTKPVGMGSGLGLSQVAGIVAQHQGHLVVESNLSQGTTFQIFLPIVQGQDPSTLSEPRTKNSKKGETILLVEDNQEVRAVTQKMLESLGYAVLATESGQQALHQLSKENAPQISLVLSDMAMPKMDGETFFHLFRTKAPNTPFLILSGYPQGEENHCLQEKGIAGWLQKPISLKTLAHEIGKHLGE